MDDTFEQKMRLFEIMYNPRSIAVVGASTHASKVGNFVLRSAISSKVETVYPIHAGGAKEILGYRAYRSIEAIPEDRVDLFLFAIPQNHILSALRSAIKKGCKAAVIFSAGFRESGPEGEKDQIALRDLANAHGVNIIGPNTLGFFSTHSSLNATFMPVLSDYFKEEGNIAVVSQSGGVAGLIVSAFIENHLRIGTLTCLGNRANVEFSDMLQYLANDPKTKIVALFIEGLDDVRSFYEQARVCATKKPVVVLGAGYTTAGQKVALSHTGSMANSEAIYKGAFKQARLFQVKTVQELVDTLKVLSYAPEPRGKKVALITHTAGPAILASDVLERGGLTLAELSAETKQVLRKEGMLPAFIPPQNPIDLATFGYMDKSIYVKIVKLLEKDPTVDCMFPICMSPVGDRNLEVFPFEEMKKTKESLTKPLVFVWIAPSKYEDEFKSWDRIGIPAYPNSERSATALVNLVRIFELRREPLDEPSAGSFSKEFFKEIDKFKSAGKVSLLEHESKRLLKLAGIDVADTYLAKTEDEAVRAANSLGYPVVMKVAHEKILHKSDAGGVKLNLKTEGEVKGAYREIVASVEKKWGTELFLGVTIQPMIPEGIEVIVGALRDEQAGPVIMFGLGGIWVEALKDVVYRLAPISVGEARKMLREIKGHPILKGSRGMDPVNEDILCELLVKTSQLIEQCQFQEIDLNPVICVHNQCLIADARIILRGQ